MKPLIIVTCFNRVELTQRCCESIIATTNFDEVLLVLVNNGSTDDTGSYIDSLYQSSPEGIRACHFKKNVGVISALNTVIKLYRANDMPVIKLDNDVIILTPNWLVGIKQLLSEYQNISMVCGYSDRLEREKKRKLIGTVQDKSVYEIDHAYGDCNLYTNGFMNRCRYFERLSSDHLYGWEDTFMYQKAKLMSMKVLTWEGWKYLSIQQSSSLPNRKEHIEPLRQIYHARCSELNKKRNFELNEKGVPV